MRPRVIVPVSHDTRQLLIQMADKDGISPAARVSKLIDLHKHNWKKTKDEPKEVKQDSKIRTGN